MSWIEARDTPGATEINAWSLSDDGLTITAYWPWQAGSATLRALVDEAGVHLLLTDVAVAPRPGEHVGWTLVGDPASAQVTLEEPLADRCVVDSVTGQSPRRVPSPPGGEPLSADLLGLSSSSRAAIAEGRQAFLDAEREHLAAYEARRKG